MTERRRIVNDAGGFLRDAIPEHAPRSGAMNPESRRLLESQDSGFVRLRLTPRNDDVTGRVRPKRDVAALDLPGSSAHRMNPI